MKNKEYWQKRFEQLEDAANKEAEHLVREIETSYQKALMQIENQINHWYQRFAKNNNITMAEARKILPTRDLAEFKWNVKDYIKYGEENALNQQWMKQLENASARYHISKLEALKVQTQHTLEVLFGNQLDDMDRLMKKIYTDGYYHSIYEIQKGFNIGWDIASIDEKKLNKIIKKPWAVDGKNFSERIWGNKTKLINELHTELTQMVITGNSPDQAIKNIAKKMNTSKNNAGRLIMTEQAYFSSESQKDAFNELEVEKFENVATLDSSTSEICQQMDGQVFDMKDYEPGVTAPPFHVWCRTTTVPYFDDEFNLGERAARDKDGKTYYVPSNMTYPQWKKSFVDGGDKSGLKEVSPGTTMKVKNINDCKTVEEVEDLMKSKQWFTVQILNGKVYDSNEKLSLTGVDLEAAKQIYISHEEVFEKFPQLVGKLSAINSAPLSSRVYAQCSVGLGSGGITVNTKKYNDHMKLLKSYENDVKHGFHPVGTDWTSIVTHEIGHAIDDFLTNTLRIAGTQRNGWKPKYVSADLRPKVMRSLGLKVSDTYKEVSGYATKDHFEWFAECFAEYMKSKNPRRVAKAFGKHLEEILKGVE